MTTNTTRRALLAAASVAPLGAMALAQDVRADVHPDRKLLELGAQFDALAARIEATQRLSEPNWNEFQRRIEEMRKTVPNSNEAYQAVFAEVDRVFPLPSPNCTELMNESEPISEAILATPARTLAGLAVKARLVRFTSSEWWDESDTDADWDHRVARSFVDAVLEMGRN